MALAKPLEMHRSWLLAVVVLAVGCWGGANGRQKITGVVTWDGEPLDGGWIYFRPVEDGTSSAGEISKGEFQIPAAQGLSPGTYKVAIEYQQPTGRRVKVYTGEEIEEKKQIIPPQFNEQTTLTAEIQAKGPNHLAFDLKPEG